MTTTVTAGTFSTNLYIFGEVSFFTGRGLLKIGGGIRYFLLDQKGIKRFFQIKKGGSLIFFEEI